MPVPAEKTTCPGCGHGLSYVIKSIPDVSTTGIVNVYRRRRCAGCGGIYTSLAEERAIPGSYTPAPRVTFTLEIMATSSHRGLIDPS